MNANPEFSIERQREIFLKALEKASPAERAAYLDGACGEDIALRGQVEALLQHHTTDSFFESPVLAAEQTQLVESVVSEGPGTVIDRYKLLQQIGEGGMGVVYMAEQEEPVRRRVALKIIKLGMDTKQVVARFEAERQALAMMDHPNIARVLDGGATETGRPYFVMELVQGVPITEFCDKNKLSAKDRLKLFVQVCQAIQSAHQKGIIHRDIKPSNVLVTLHHGDPMPKVIDFGIAKATNQKLTEKTLFTNYATMIGTPAYMSPEQAEMSSMDVDTRTDVYALGVLLYELLTGTTPFPEKRLRSLGYGEMQRIIVEEEPERPSTRLSTMANEQKTAVAKNRGAELIALSKLLKGDLDWVVMKCLEKDRTRRYETANGVAADIQRFLGNEPIVARPPSAAYRFEKLVRRNKLAFAAAAVVTIALIAGLSVAAIAWRQTRIERDSAVKARAGEAAQRLKAEANEQQAREAQTNEAAERDKAQQNLYDSLLREARATRSARRVGYRDDVFKLLKQARDLVVAKKDLSDLRREAVACLGDFVGLTPTMFTDFPTPATFTNFETELRIRRTSLDPAGRLAAFALSDGSILLREMPLGKEIGRLKGDYPPRSLRFDAQGNRLVSVHIPELDWFQEQAYRPLTQAQLAGSVVHLWGHTEDGTWSEIEKLPLPGANECLSSVKGLCLIVTDLTSHSVQLVDLKTREVEHRLEFPEEIFGAPLAALTPDGQSLLTQTRNPREPTISVLDLWDLRTGQRTRRRKSGLPLGVHSSADGKHLACITDLGVAIYAADRFEQVTEVAGNFRQLLENPFAPGGTVIALPFWPQSSVRLWDWTQSEDIAVLEEPQDAHRTTFASDGSFLVTSGDHRAAFYRLNVSAEKLSLSGHVGGVPGIVFSPDGTRLASVGQDRTTKIWDSVTARVEWDSGLLPMRGESVAYSADGRLLVTTDFDSQLVRIWDVQTRSRLLEFGRTTERVTWLALFGSDGKYLLTASDDAGTNSGVKVWGIQSQAIGTPRASLGVKLVKSFACEPGQSLVIAPDGQHFSFVDWRSNRLYVWDFNGATAPRLLATNTFAGVRPLSFTPDSRSLMTADANWAVVTLDAETGRKMASFPTIDQTPRTAKPTEKMICLSPDGTKLALLTPFAPGADVWDPKTGRLLYSLPEQKDIVWWLAWSPDSQRLAVSRSNGEIAIWNLPEIERVLAGLGLSP